MATALLGLGSNLGDRAAALERAIELLKAEPQVRVEAVSSFRPSKPAGGPEGQGEFINAAARLETSLAPEELLAKILAIEDQVGRVRVEHWGPRVMDLDLLLYDRVEIKTPTPELPHPRMCYRRFVLEPAAEIGGEMVWPVNGWTVKQLLAHLNCTARYIAIGCVREDFGRIVGPISQAGCRIIYEVSHMDVFAEIVGANVTNPPENWMERVLDLECQRNAESLAKANWPQNMQWTISDFWAELDLNTATSLLAGNDNPYAAEVFDKLENYRLSAQQPRLVILLDDGNSALADTYVLVEQLRRKADSPPSLWLSMDEPIRVEQEVLAAMQAME